jgi:hypothetical protein
MRAAHVEQARRSRLREVLGHMDNRAKVLQSQSLEARFAFEFVNKPGLLLFVDRDAQCRAFIGTRRTGCMPASEAGRLPVPADDTWHTAPPHGLELTRDDHTSVPAQGNRCAIWHLTLRRPAASWV